MLIIFISSKTAYATYSLW